MIDILHRHTKAILYHSDTAQTIAAAVEEARKNGASLICSDLRGSDLSYSDLSCSDLSGANLCGANLSGSDLRGSTLPAGYRIASLCFGGWDVTVGPFETSIGCERHPNAKWLEWTKYAPEIAVMHPDAAAWWAQHREAVCAVIRDVRAEPATAGKKP